MVCKSWLRLARVSMGAVALLAVAQVASCSTQRTGDAAPAWTGDSNHLEVTRTAAFSSGLLHLRADRNQLSAQELSDLGEMTPIDPLPGCVADADSYEVSITRADGTMTIYHAHAGDGACSSPSPLIAFSTFEPFRQTVACLSPTLIPGPWLTQTLVPDARCRNEIPMNEGTVDVPFEIGAAGEVRHIELDQCDGAGRADRLHAVILPATGTTPLAQASAPADPGADHTCLRIDHTFETSGAYRLQIVADPGFPTDRDFYLRSY